MARDRNGNLVHQFQLRMDNLGHQRMAQEIVAMLDSEAWRQYDDGLGRVELRPGEFDYFLSLVGVGRSDVMTGIRDLDLKARIEAAMDERGSRDPDYRRPYDEVKKALGRRRTVEPFGLTEADSQALVRGTRMQPPGHRKALGDAVRRYRKTGDARAPSRKVTRVDQLRRAIERLSAEEFAELVAWLAEHRRSRRRLG